VPIALSLMRMASCCPLPISLMRAKRPGVKHPIAVVEQRAGSGWCPCRIQCVVDEHDGARVRIAVLIGQPTSTGLRASREPPCAVSRASLCTSDTLLVAAKLT